MATYLISNFRGGNNKVYQINFDWLANAGVPGQYIELEGRCDLVRPKVKNMFETVRGSELKMYFTVTNEQDRIGVRDLAEISGDKEVKVRLYENGARIWEGWLKPDGILESFIYDRYEVEMTALDGLGLLDNIKYLQPDGKPYFGKARELDILLRCLKLTGLTQADAYLYEFNLFYQTVNDLDVDNYIRGAVNNSWVNQERYYKDDVAESGFSCKEVIDGVLKKYGAFVMYENDNFHIKRIAFYYNQNLNLIDRVKYNLNAQILGTEVAYGKKETLGSQVNNAEVFHAGSSISVNYKGSIGAYKAVYKYGGVRSILRNRFMIYDLPSFGQIQQWSDLAEGFRAYVLDDLGYRVQLRSEIGSYYPNSAWLPPTNVTAVLQTLDYPDLEVSEGTSLFVQFKGEAYLILAKMELVVEVAVVSSDVIYYLGNDGRWREEQTYMRILNEQRLLETFDFSFDIATDELPVDGRVRVTIYRPLRQDKYVFIPTSQFPPRSLMYAKFTEIVVNGNIEQRGIKGESYTGIVNNKPISIVEVDDEIYVGDSDTDIYVGAIESFSGENSAYWKKAYYVGGDSPRRKLLEWLVRDRLMIQRGNQKEFSGSMYGVIDYNKLLNIDSFTEAFMFTEWAWDIAANKVDYQAVCIFNEELEDNEISVDFQLETDNVVKPTVVG